MIRIAEKLEFMNDRAVKVCTKTANRRRQEPQNPGFCADFQQSCLGKENP